MYGDMWKNAVERAFFTGEKYIMFHRVLVATGGSPWSDNAVKYAIGLARDYQLEVVILHVLTETPPYFTAEAGIQYDTELVWGRVPEVICRVAQEHDCDLIVVGSRGLTGFKRLMLGSISNAVAAKAPCPVLVVKLHEA